MLCLPVLTPLMHNSLLSHSNLLHPPSDNPSSLPSLLSDNLLPPLFLNNNPSSLNKPSNPSNPSSLNNPSNPSNPSKHNSNSQ